MISGSTIEHQTENSDSLNANLSGQSHNGFESVKIWLHPNKIPVQIKADSDSFVGIGKESV